MSMTNIVIAGSVLFLILFIVSAYLFLWIRHVNARVSRHSANFKQMESSLQGRIKHLESICSDAHSKSMIENVRKDLAEKYDSDIKELKEETTKLTLMGQAPKTDPVTNEKIIKVQYTHSSNSKGEFRDDELSDKPQRNTFFEISVLSSGEAAYVTIYNGLVFDQGIFSASDQYFGSVSQFENKWREGHSKMIVLKPGKLRKSGQGWIIQERIQVRFE
jgi:hypothetical protein